MNETQEKHEYAFQAEVGRLLDLLANSLYQSKEIALRELISNAADALDKRRYLGLTDDRHRVADELRIRVEPNARELAVIDNGVGMSRDELADHLGSIAKSGSLEFLNELAQRSADGKPDVALIGRFGVGFYSAFMLAERVEVFSKSCRAPAEESGWCWESTGAGTYAIRPAPEYRDVGTRIVLHLKPDLQEEFSSKERVKRILRQYSGFIPHPIYLGDDRVNDVRPIWVEPKNQVTDEQHAGFYRHLTHGGADKPLWRLHLSADSPIQFHALLYCPPTNPELLGFPRLEQGVNLCARRVLVQQECRDLLPEYLRFLVGVVDAEDLPLNISRETLQDNAVLRKIRATLVRKTLDKLAEVAENPADYAAFYKQFAAILKEGFHEEHDAENRKRLAKLLRFATTQRPEADATGLDDYVARMAPEQKRIYYLGGPSLDAAAKSPHLEVFRKRGVEVLLLGDPIDDYVLSLLREYDGKPLTSVDAADLDLPPAKTAEAKPDAEPPSPGFERLLTVFRQTLAGRVKDVRESARLTDSPACLVSADGPSAQMQRLIRLSQDRGGQTPTAFERVLEVNPRSAFIRRLGLLSQNPELDGFIQDCGRQLLDNALVLEGGAVEPQAMVERVQRLMETAAEKSSAIIV